MNLKRKSEKNFYFSIVVVLPEYEFLKNIARPSVKCTSHLMHRA